MAEDKKKIVVYADWVNTFDALTDEEAGKLIKHFFYYVNDLNPQSDRLTELMFTPIKLTLKRDLTKWEEMRSRRVESGSKGGKQKVANVASAKKNVANVAVSDSVSVSVSVIDNNIPTPTKVGDIDFSILLETINKIFGREFVVVSDAVKKKYKTLLKQGYTKTHIHTAMLNCKKDTFHKDNDYKHCTIEYFSRPKTIDLYGTELITEKKGIVGTFTIHDHD